MDRFSDSGFSLKDYSGHTAFSTSAISEDNQCNFPCREKQILFFSRFFVNMHNLTKVLYFKTDYR